MLSGSLSFASKKHTRGTAGTSLNEMENDGIDSLSWPLSPERPLLKLFAPGIDDQNETNKYQQ